MSQAVQTAAVERELKINASPETVFSFFTDADKLVQWMGREATIDARPGGAIRLDYNGFDVMRGEFVELTPHSRIVFTWGWDNAESTPRAGASRVTITLTPDGDGTIVKLVHDGLSEEEGKSHGEGWDHFLPRLGAVAAGREPGRDEWAPRRAEIKAADLRDKLQELEDLVESCSDEAWLSTNTAEGWPVCVLAHHITVHLGLLDVAKAIAAGERPPQADSTPEMLDFKNAERATVYASVSRDQVLHAIREYGPPAVQTLREMPDEDLDKSISMAIAGGATITVEQILDGPMLANMREHLDSLRGALST